MTSQLPPAQLKERQQETLAAPRLRYSWAARALFAFMGYAYGRTRTFPKLKVLEVVARVPCQAWENVAYVAVTHRYSELASPGASMSGYTRVASCRTTSSGTCSSWLLYALKPAWSYRLNADFEDHAEHEYALFAEEHPGLEGVPYHSLCRACASFSPRIFAMSGCRSVLIQATASTTGCAPARRVMDGQAVACNTCNMAHKLDSPATTYGPRDI